MRTVLLLVLGLLAAPAVPADEAADRGLEIAREAETRYDDYRDQRAEAVLTIRTANGDEAMRRMHARSLETGDGSRNLTIVDEPRDVAGTALLTHSYDDRSDQQWLLLPALNRVKRIASGNRSGAFMGSEFTYEDFTAQPVAKFEVRLLREETLDGEPCYVLERTPGPGAASAYARHVAWLDKAHYRTLKVEYYNRAGQHQKTLRARDFKRYRNGQWRARELTMSNHLGGGTSVLEWSGIEFGNGYSERDFTVDALKRAR
jgi:outer membrane lipoprotein-sorting protein